jgi:hypothetical protein
MKAVLPAPLGTFGTLLICYAFSAISLDMQILRQYLHSLSLWGLVEPKLCFPLPSFELPPLAFFPKSLPRLPLAGLPPLEPFPFHRHWHLTQDSIGSSHFQQLSSHS